MAAAAAGKKSSSSGMPAGALRVGLTCSGFFGAATYARAEMTDVHGRTFGVWTLLSCTLCFLCAFNLDNRPLYMATFLSFVYAYAHFILEYLVYHTFTAANLGSFALVAVTSIVWMLLQWNSHAPRAAAKRA
ncbi:ergosterol biosynthetic protein 28-like [Panicum virgatum]|uniref:Ergosterol biosynthetic protein 28 n=1 Tax=Panicum virgatum TaxID=38727 RepID=A0A8T0WPR4_PANVG|nr:ergosterol biosynthetic protein 28-like [Panicum virgatum]KAG2648137.1 hypothetical protein PVAP13_1NG047700 [Panicum virgatum]